MNIIFGGFDMYDYHLWIFMHRLMVIHYRMFSITFIQPMQIFLHSTYAAGNPYFTLILLRTKHNQNQIGSADLQLWNSLYYN